MTEFSGNDESVPVPDNAPDTLRLHSCQKLLRFAIGEAQSWDGGRKPTEAADLLILSIHARSTRTYEAIVKHLGTHAFGEQGAMLNRSLFEDMVDAHWVSLNPELAVERVAQHDKWTRLLRGNVQRAFPFYFDDREPPAIELSNEERAELRTLFGDYGQHSWTGVRSFYERSQSILGCWKTEEAREQVRWMRAWVHRLNTETLHLSAFSMGRLAAPEPNPESNAWQFRFGSTREWLPHALSCAFWCYAQTFGLIIDTFGISSQEKLESEVMAPWRRAWEDASRWEQTGYL